MRRFLISIIGFSFLSSLAHAALLPPAYLNNVVALGNEMNVEPDPNKPPRLEWATIGTGFFYAYLHTSDPDPKKNTYDMFLVTARHVVADYAHLQMENPKLDDLKVRVNPRNSPSSAQEFSIPSHPPSNAATWFYDPNPSIDIAVVSVNFALLRAQGIDPGAFTNDQQVASREKMQTEGVSPGDGVFVLGFPMNLAGKQRNYVIAREGCVARIAEMIDGASPYFLIDSFVFPGNSGGPVVLKPDITAIQDTKAISHPYFIGVVTAYLPYTDIAVSPQTKHTRVTFEENSGLAEVLPPDYIDETIRAWQAANPLLVPAAPGKP
jgi:Trypsin-like peptidase domain